jgi:hypothetical protein
MDRAKLALRLEELAAHASEGDKTGFEEELAELRSFAPRVQRFGFFETGKPAKSESGRAFVTDIPLAEARYVAWQVELEYATRAHPLEIRFDWKMVLEDGSLFAEQSLRTILLPEWKTSWHTASWGWEKPGQWKKGKHEAIVTIWGEALAQGHFSII